MSSHVRKIIQDKREWHSQATAEDEALGFKGWYSRGYLPHFDMPGLLQFITYRLADAFPVSLRHEWEALLHLEDDNERIRELEAYLDKGRGECHLRDSRVAAVVEENLLHFDGKSYRLIAWVIMPNHVHALIEIHQTPLSDVLQAWKSYTGKKANQILRRTGQFWQDEYFDRCMRDGQHSQKSVRYIEKNPVSAGLVSSPQEWQWGSARLRNRESNLLGNATKIENASSGAMKLAGGPPALL